MAKIQNHGARLWPSTPRKIAAPGRPRRDRLCRGDGIRVAFDAVVAGRGSGGSGRRLADKFGFHAPGARRAMGAGPNPSPKPGGRRVTVRAPSRNRNGARPPHRSQAARYGERGAGWAAAAFWFFRGRVCAAVQGPGIEPVGRDVTANGRRSPRGFLPPSGPRPGLLPAPTAPVKRRPPTCGIRGHGQRIPIGTVGDRSALTQLRKGHRALRFGLDRGRVENKPQIDSIAVSSAQCQLPSDGPPVAVLRI